MMVNMLKEASGFAERWRDVSVWITVVMPSGQQERKIIM